MTSLVRTLHRSSFLRRIARLVCGGITLRQSFHGGWIFFNAVEHSWAWTNRVRYETFDSYLQTTLLRLSLSHDHIIDIGANVGAMSLSVALRNPQISILALEPNPKACALLARSIRRNRLGDRMHCIQAALSPSSGTLTFDTTGSVTGHVSENGTCVRAITPAELLASVPSGSSILIKMDIEGYETVLLPHLLKSMDRRSCTLVIELHPIGLNQLGDPAACFRELLASGAELLDERFNHAESIVAGNFSNIIARWSSSPPLASP